MILQPLSKSGKQTNIQSIATPSSKILPPLTKAQPKPQVKVAGFSDKTPKEVQEKVTKSFTLLKAKTPTYKLPNGIKLDLVDSQQAPSAQTKITKQSLEQAKKIDQKISKINQTVTKIFPQTSEQFKDLEADPLSLNSNQRAISTAINTIRDSYANEQQKFKELDEALKTSKSTSKKVGKGLEAVASQAGFIFSPISAFFAAANEIPLIGSVSKLITLPFTAVGEGATETSNKIVDQLPISNEAKENIKPGLGEIFALAAQILLGKGSDVARKRLTKEYGLQEALTIEVQAKKLAKEKQSVIESGKSYTPEEIQGKIIGSGFEKTPEGKTLLKASLDAQKENKMLQLSTQEVKGATIEQPKVTLEGKTPSKIAESIERKAIEDKLTEGFGHLAEYEKITIKDQAAKAVKVMENIDDARAIIRGEKPLPEGLKGTALITAAEQHIKKTGDAKMAYDLANSRLVSETSAAAQEMRLAAERQPDSLAQKLLDLKKEKEDAVKRKTGKSIDKAIKSEADTIKAKVRKSAPKKEDWASFIESIKC